jgi:predicted flap endonuclease-1-like 5' DNA nuclease
MGHLADDMTRLCGDIGTLRDTREAFINSLKQDVAQIQSEVGRMQHGFRDAHATMARDTKAKMEAFVSEIRQAVLNLKEDATEMQNSSRNAHKDMAKRTKAERGAFVSGLKEEVARMQHAFRDAQARMSRETKSDLSVFLSGVRDFVSGMKATVNNLQQDFATDIAGARKAWSGVSPAKRRPFKDKGRARPEKTEVRIPNDLTTIPGIGQGMQRLLNNAGIYDFAQLAGSTPEHLRHILGRAGQLADVENWIDQARKLGNV